MEDRDPFSPGDAASSPSWHWYLVGRPVFSHGNEVQLLRGGEELFPAMVAAIRRSRHEIWLASYIVHDDAAAETVLCALLDAAARGVRVRMVVDGFGSNAALDWLERRLASSTVALAVFRPLRRWTHWLQPGQLRRLHMKLCIVDGDLGFVGGINLIDDCIDLHHGRSELPRLDFAVLARGPVVAPMEQAARAMWSRAWFGRDWRIEARALLQARQPWRELRAALRGLRLTRHRQTAEAPASPRPVQCAFLVRDNLRQRRTIERSAIQAVRNAKRSVWLVTPYFYPGGSFRKALKDAAQRGVEVHLLLQGKIDYRLAAWAAQALYDDLLRQGIHIHEYLPAFLHAKVLTVDDAWSTVGSSNFDPLSLLLNLEANLVVSDPTFAGLLRSQLESAAARSREVRLDDMSQAHGWTRWVRRALVAWCAYVYLRLAGVSGRY